MKNGKIIIGSRGSDLALWQAYYTRDQLHAIGLEVEIKIIKTKGDQIQHLSFDKLEGKGFFTKELEDALLAGAIDLAVHSHKDLPTTQPEGLFIAGVSYREDCSETILIRPESADKAQVFGVKRGAVVGTSSLRRRSQLLHRRSDIEIRDLRGNVPTRIEKLRRGDYDAIVLATAGINRLALPLDDLVMERVPPHEFIPAAAQGVLAYQTRANDLPTIAFIRRISRADVAGQITAERIVLNRLEGGCQLPLGVYCQTTAEGAELWAALQPLSGEPFRRLFVRAEAPSQLAEKALHALVRNEHRTVYISRDALDAETFRRQLENYGYAVITQSPLRFETIETNHLPLTDWIFFTSKQGVMHFFGQNLMAPATALIGAIGSGTSAALKEVGIRPHFIGHDGDTQETAQSFSEIAKGREILFPCAEKGLRTVQQALEPLARVIDLPVYRSIPNAMAPVQADIFVFTSPSAFNAYFASNGLPEGQLIAMGRSTREAIKAKGIEAEMPPMTTEQALADLVCGL